MKPPDSTTRDIVAAFRRAALKPGKPFMVAGRVVLTYGELLDRVARLTRLYSANGLRQGDRVIVASNNDVDTVVLFLSLLRNGLTAVLMDPGAPASAARPLIESSAARGIILDAALRQTWRPDKSLFTLEIAAPVEGTSLFSKLLPRRNAAEQDATRYPAVLSGLRPADLQAEVPPDLDAYVLFTSGTTSRPKGVRIGHDNWSWHLDTLTRQFGYDDSARILNVLPLHHTDGLTQGPSVAFWNGATVYRPMPFTVPNIGPLLDTVYSERITHFVAVPTILSLILRFGQEYKDCFQTDDFSFVISAAAQLNSDLWTNFESSFGKRVANLYGLTETVTGGLFAGPGDADHKVGTVGRPVDCEARIVGEDDAELPSGVAGELVMRGRNIMKGYLNAPEATSQVIRDGWLHTGDIAVRDADGFFRIVGRKKNTIISGGMKVHPEEITEVLDAHPGVIESYTFGVEDVVWGERIVSAVVADSKADLCEARLVEHCRTMLPPAKVPHRIHTVPELPKGPSGKPIKDKVYELISRGTVLAQDGGAASVSNRVYVVAAQCFKVPVQNLRGSSAPRTVPGWDSMAHLHFVVALEEAFGIRLSPRDIMQIQTLADAERIVAGKGA